ncbi:MAG: hypothetical protein AAF434_19270 [Pseudomonadota bacterium]
MKRVVMFALLIWAMSFRAHAIDPSLEWQTLATDHFRIHFADKAQSNANERIARRVARIAESTHAGLSEWMQWQPEDPVHVVISDESDSANGYATPIPYNRTVLFLAAPRSVRSLEDYDDWLSMLFRHEYLHILHLDKRHDLPADVSDVLGRYFLLFPNAIQPLWFVEGLAVSHETRRAIGVGRGQSSYFRMLMRNELQKGLKPAEQVNQRVREWPAGAVPYLYGTYFMQFVESEFGEDAIKQWVEAYSDNLLPAAVNSTAKEITGETVPQLWLRFEEWLRKRLASGDTANALEGEWLTDHGYQTGSISVDAESNVYYVRNDHLLRPALMQLNDDAPIELAHLNPGATIDAHAQNGVVIAQPEICNNYSIYFDLFIYSDNTTERLTHCARYIEARWSAQGEGFIAVHASNGVYALHQLNRDGSLDQVLWTGNDTDVLGGVDVAPDGNQLVAAVWRAESGWNIEEFDLRERHWTKLTESPLIEADPHYDATGEHIYFSAEYGGAYNVWRHNKNSGTFDQLTRVGGGAFGPVPTPQGALYYRGSHAGGFDIYKLHTLESLRALASAPHSPLMPPPATETDDSAPAEHYSALPSLRPRWWLPRLVLTEGANEVGFVTGGNDAIDRHAYAVTLAADVDNGYPIGGFVYTYSPSRDYSILVAGSSLNDVDLDGNDDVERVRREDQLHLNVVFPLNGLARSWRVLAGISSDYESEQETASDLTALPSFRDNLAGIALTYNSSIETPLSVSRADGRDVRLMAENSGVFDSDFSGNVYVLDWREFVRLGNSPHVLSLRFARGYGTDTPRPFELGGLSSNNVLELLGSVAGEALLNRRGYELRGYDDDVPGLIGRRMQLVSAEWRFPIALIERGLMAPAVGINRVFGRVFIENGAAWRDSADDTFSSAGFELHVDASALYFSDIRLRLGYAHGFDDEFGEDEVYLTLGGGF